MKSNCCFSPFSCTPAYPKIPVNIVKKYCHPFYIKNPILCTPDAINSELLFADREQQELSERRLRNVILGKKLLEKFKDFYVRPSCIKVYQEVSCKSNFPRCLLTGFLKPAEQPICRETCENKYKKCDREHNMTVKFEELSRDIPYEWIRENCRILPRRNAGEIPECYYSRSLNSELEIPFTLSNPNMAFINQPTNPSTHQTTHPSNHPSNHPPTHPSTHQPTYSPTSPPTHPPTHLPNHLRTNPPTCHPPTNQRHPSIYPSVHRSIPV